ncbi:MAG: recombinase zinc beta ribbon domain-containing protein, partial [Clostridia bacterium]|nr:recombinase zinc beta ribbon domain-containing protein [Clostridia bacterium]
TPMTLNTVSNMLTNRRYIGEYSYKHVFLPDGIPAIISKELFERVQRKIAINRKSPAKHKAQEDYILSTKLYCGTCMTYMVGESGTSQNQSIYSYYKCLSSKRKRGCDRKAVKKDWIEDIVIEMIMKLIWDDALIERLTDLVMKEQANECTAVPLLKKQLKEVEKAIANVLKAIEQGIITTNPEALDTSRISGIFFVQVY